MDGAQRGEERERSGRPMATSQARVQQTEERRVLVSKYLSHIGRQIERLTAGRAQLIEVPVLIPAGAASELKRGPLCAAGWEVVVDGDPHQATVVMPMLVPGLTFPPRSPDVRA